MITITRTGHAKFMATNGFDTINAAYKRGTANPPIAPRWELAVNGDRYIISIAGNKDAAIKEAVKILGRPGSLPMWPSDMLAQFATEGETNNYIHGIVPVHISDIIDNDLEGFLDILSERLTGGVMLMDINYNVVDEEDNTLYIRVSGDASNILDESDDEEGDGDDEGI